MVALVSGNPLLSLGDWLFMDLEKILYSNAEVQGRIDRDAVVLIDIRDRDQYLAGHLPGAVNVPEFFYYLAETTPEGIDLLHRTFKSILERAGVDPDKPAIVYEHSLETWYGGSCRGFWLLSYLGHPRAGVLEQGLVSWIMEGRPLQTGVVDPPPSVFELRPQAHMMATREQMLQVIHDPSIIVIDNRHRDEWLGTLASPYEPDYDLPKGRIPGAIWIEWYNFLKQSLEFSTFKSPNEIRQLCAAYGLRAESDIVLYCFKGARSANTFVALSLAGFRKVRVYLGSWNEWSRDPSRPI
jgi:thiosulfate/3-mercaptopyruvate sulfurtransferase